MVKIKYSMGVAPLIVIIAYITSSIGFLMDKVNGYVLTIITLIIIFIIAYANIGEVDK